MNKFLKVFVFFLLALCWINSAFAAGSIYCDGGTNCQIISTATHAAPIKVTLPSGTNNLVTPPLTPGGRLSLINYYPIMYYDYVGATTLYYIDYTNDLVPLYNGTNWAEYPLNYEISLTLDDVTSHTGYQASGSMFDVFAYNNLGTLALCTGPAWTNLTTKSAATTTINGIVVNTASISLKCDTTASVYTAGANQATLLGSIFIPSAATTLSAAITTTGATSASVTSACGTGGTGTYCFPYAANFYIKVDSEVMLVTAGQGTTTWTITRGQRGTTAATHLINAAVTMDGGQTLAQFKPTAVAGGSNPALLISNLYNRVPVTVFDSDSTSSYSYTSAAYRPNDNSNANRVTFIDPAGSSQSKCTLFIGINSTSATGSAGCGYGTNSSITGTVISDISLTITSYLSAFDTQFPTTGLQYYQGMEYGGTGVTYYAGGYNGYRLQLDTMY